MASLLNFVSYCSDILDIEEHSDTIENGMLKFYAHKSVDLFYVILFFQVKYLSSASDVRVYWSRAGVKCVGSIESILIYNINFIYETGRLIHYHNTDYILNSRENSDADS